MAHLLYEDSAGKNFMENQTSLDTETTGSLILGIYHGAGKNKFVLFVSDIICGILLKQYK
jgi:hypothetical protein